MRPCTGIPDVCPPLCTMADINTGKVTLANIEEFHHAMDEMYQAKLAAMNG